MQTILITGASSGIGRHAALALARAGHRMFAAARRESVLPALAAEQPGIEPIVLDVTDAASIAAAEQEVMRRTDAGARVWPYREYLERGRSGERAAHGCVFVD